MSKTALIGIKRLRMGSDGHGITTLVGFHGCPLRCRYCLNPQCLSNGNNLKEWTPEEVMKVLLKDELYYITSCGGATFGGGEPLLWPDFIIDVLDLGAKRWHTTIETSLNVPFVNIERLLPYIDEYVIDIKDMNPQVYEEYTGKDNQLVISNLKKMVEIGLASRMICRIPLIPGFNNINDQSESERELRNMGFTRIDKFNYIIK